MGDGHGHGHGHGEPYYLHAKHMYNSDRMKNQKLKKSLAVFTAFGIGAAAPVYAVVWACRYQHSVMCDIYLLS